MLEKSVLITQWLIKNQCSNIKDILRITYVHFSQLEISSLVFLSSYCVFSLRISRCDIKVSLQTH